MGSPGWTPVDENAAKWTPVDETQAHPQGFWDRVSAALHPRKASDMPGAKTVTAKEVFSSQHPNPGSSEGANFAEALHDYDKASGGELAGGVVDIIQGNIAKGIHRIVSGAGAGITPAMPLFAPAMAAAPVKTALSIAGGIGGSQLASAGAGAFGGSKEQAEAAGDIGGIVGGMVAPELPALTKGLVGRALLLGKTPQEAYQSALKPSTTIRPVKVANIVKTGLEEEIPVSKAGMEKLGSLIDDVNDKIAAEIGGGKGVTIDPAKVAARADQIRGRFANQVNPKSDLEAIEAAKQEFLSSNKDLSKVPSWADYVKQNMSAAMKSTGSHGDAMAKLSSDWNALQENVPLRPIPAAQAQAMKQGTYQQLGSKAYGEVKTASMEAQKALARGLKEELADAFPELKGLNARDSKLYDLEPVLQKAIQREANHQLGGIGTPITAGAAKAITGSNKAAAIAGFLKAIVDNPNVKSRLAISLAKASGLTFPQVSSRIAAYSAALAASSANSATRADRTDEPQE